MKVPKLAYAIAVVLAILAGTAVYFFQSTADQRALAGKQAVTVLVALRDIPKNTSLSTIQSNGMASLETYPLSSVPGDSLKGFDAANAALVATHGIAKGQILTQGSFGDAVQALAGIQIPDGKVAATFDIPDAPRMTGFVLPGSEVAVLYTFANDKGISITRVLLPRVTVLAIGATTDVTENQAAAGQPSLVTLALTQKEAESIVLAKKIGEISFALLGQGTNLIPDAGTSQTGISGN